jgi:hypothetical protein
VFSYQQAHLLGSFHKPHNVKRGSIYIDNVGSSHETSLAEAQQKSLGVLDAFQEWKCIVKIPLDFGRKHFHATSLDSVENNTLSSVDNVVKSGDRVVMTRAKDELEEMRQLAAPGNVLAVDAHIQTSVIQEPSWKYGKFHHRQWDHWCNRNQSTLTAFLAVQYCGPTRWDDGDKKDDKVPYPHWPSDATSQAAIHCLGFCWSRCFYG